nr:hypothetical protein [Natronosporangium hydrolyticum]
MVTGLRRLTERTGEPAARWARENYRGRTVNLVGGPAVATAAVLAAAAGARQPRQVAVVLTAGVTAGAVGLYDDLVGGRPGQQAKGFRGHLGALRQGRLTSGMVKLGGVGAAGLVAAALLPVRSPGARPISRPQAALSVALGAGVVAGAANLLNLLDLRPGRALKVAVVVGAPLAVSGQGGWLAAGPVGVAAAALPADLRERIMLGDCGANTLGALLGAAYVARAGLAGRASALVLLAGLTAASEQVSFTRVIATTPVLRQLDEWGRGDGDPPPAVAPGN